MYLNKFELYLINIKFIILLKFITRHQNALLAKIWSLISMQKNLTVQIHHIMDAFTLLRLKSTILFNCLYKYTFSMV